RISVESSIEEDPSDGLDGQGKPSAFLNNLHACVLEILGIPFLLCIHRRLLAQEGPAILRRQQLHLVDVGRLHLPRDPCVSGGHQHPAPCCSSLQRIAEQVVPDPSIPNIIQHQQELVPSQETLHQGLQQTPALFSTMASTSTFNDISEKIRLAELLGHAHPDDGAEAGLDFAIIEHLLSEGGLSDAADPHNCQHHHVLTRILLCQLLHQCLGVLLQLLANHVRLYHGGSYATNSTIHPWFRRRHMELQLGPSGRDLFQPIVENLDFDAHLMSELDLVA
ncbi:unnamed protein product, partial [Musa acuminata var. zebrina]